MCLKATSESFGWGKVIIRLNKLDQITEEEKRGKRKREKKKPQQAGLWGHDPGGQ